MWVLALLLTWGASAHALCPTPCKCMDTRVDCKGVAFRHVPNEFSRFITMLDLSSNNISHLPDFVFSRYHYLEELNLGHNGIEFLTGETFHGLSRLKELILQDNNLTQIPVDALHPLVSLETLRLDGNMIADIPPALAEVNHVTKLCLGSNYLTRVPTEALSHMYNLEALDLSGNDIVEVKNYSFSNLSQLVILALQNNRILNIYTEAFDGLNNLKILELNNNYLTKIPSAIAQLPSLERLTVAYNNIRFIEDDIFLYNKNLEIIEVKKNPLQNIGHYAFSNMTKLKKLIISEVKQLDQFPDLNGTSSLEILRVDRAKIAHLPNNLCLMVPRLKSLDLKSNLLTEIPNLKHCHGLRLLDLTNNKITSLRGQPFQDQSNLHDLLMGDNQIQLVPADAFVGLAKLQILDLVHNQINEIDEDAFIPVKQLEDLNLGNNRFPNLPSKGLTNIRHLKTFNNKFLKEFPPPTSFPRIQSLALSYAYHCCEFLPLTVLGENHQQHPDVNEMIIWPPKDKLPDLSLWSANNTDIWPGFENLTARFGEFADDIWGNFGPDYTYPSNLPQLIEEYFEDYKAQHISDHSPSVQGIRCIPQPGPFMPCEDLFDWWTLRCGVWIVFLLAMLGNGTVVFVLIFSRSKMDVPRFLVCNLALADFFMGIYLGFLAVVDASTLGEFKMYAIKWQSSAACQVAGFLGVLSSELSVYTLSVITLERNYAITHAMHLNKRLSLRHASYIMGCGWTYAIAVSSLPLFGISDYRKFAICLPFETEDDLSLGYVVFLMSVNGLAFLILMGCYLKMYCAIRGSQAWNSNDSRIAKRMALLVFTDFICWAPIAFFSLTAAFGLQLISLEEAKVFTVFILPLNSCANPFLYAILTKQFKKDCVLICKAIEESRVTRGIGHCRHSSNFSNRHTPGNTNSVERNSSNNGQVCNCHLKPNSNMKDGGKSKTKPWRFYLLCDTNEPEQDSQNEYAYALAEIQRNQHKPHNRHSSVSSENFSSSRSDSWKQHHQRRDGAHGPAARLLEKRRRNSWTITRKPSQDSNLSNSRNDSSATTASTSTWRVSRSSVSSDGSVPKSKQSIQQQPSTSAPETALHISRHGSVRDRSGVNVVTAQSSPKHNLGPSVRPKLQRQVAIDDNWSDSDNDNCKLSEVVLEVNASNDQPVVSVECCSKSVRHGLSVGFIPRKLSTISSRSCSINHEPNGSTPLTDEQQENCGKGKKTRSLSLLVIPTEPKLVPKRFASDDVLQTPPWKRLQKDVFTFEDDDDVFDDQVGEKLIQSSANSDKINLCDPKEKQPLIVERTDCQ